MLEYHPIEAKASDGHPVEYPQNILANDFEGSLSKLDCCKFQKNVGQYFDYYISQFKREILVMLIEHLSIPVIY